MTLLINARPVRPAIALMLATSSMTVMPQSAAQAQALTPVVDVCTGLSLNESALTNLLNAVNQPIVTPLPTA